MIGARVKALREASGLSLRDLAERSGVSAPMLSQVERGETSPTLTVAARIAAGLGPAPLAAAAPRRGRRGDDRAGRASASEAATPAAGTASRSSPRPSPVSAPSSHATRSDRGVPRARPMTRRCTSPAAARPRSSRRARWSSSATAERYELAEGDCVTFDADLPHHFENPDTGGGLPGRRLGRAEAQLMTTDGQRDR